MEKRLKSNLILLIAALIWGLAFVAQRVGAQYLGAFSYNGIRFALGSLSLLPLILWQSKKDSPTTAKESPASNTWLPGIIIGVILFFAASLQQIGLSTTTAGKAAFITGLYLVLVPFFAFFLKHTIKLNMWLGAVIALIGLYILSVNENFSIASGDLLVLTGAFFWAFHILTIDHFSKKVDPLKLSCVQFITCAVLSLIVALCFEKITLTAISKAIIPILYGGICSVGIAFTLQIIGQKYAKASDAAIVLSMETVFASLGGLVILHENLGLKGYLGCALMLAGMLLSQITLPEKTLPITEPTSKKL